MAEKKTTCVRESKLTVERQFIDGKRVTSQDIQNERIEILVFEDVAEVASTSVKLGITVSPKPYESVRCDVSVSIPHYVEESQGAFLFALGLAEKHLAAALGSEEDRLGILDRAKKIVRGGGK